LEEEYNIIVKWAQEDVGTLYNLLNSYNNSNSVPAQIRRCDDLPATITHVPVAAVIVLNTPDDGRLRPKHIE
jgi:hypothetical protein